ncbi:MAG: hypothetical protein IPI67_22515 [Myxococcales bacterium]|nr:hypothetical protein [Myxococcales bacterium]
MGRAIAAATTVSLGLGALWSAPGCLSVADAVSTGGSGAILATGGKPTSGGGGSSGGGGASGSSTGGSGAGTGVEDCQNGVDDDGDAKVDCADPDCVPEYTCVDLPSGWSALRKKTQAWSPALPAPTACADGSSAKRQYQGPAGPAQCGACSCGSPTGSCNGTTISCAMGNKNCSAATSLIVGTCTNFPAPSAGEISCFLGTSVSGGDCPASGGELASSNPWASAVDTCPDVAGGCAAGKLCAPAANTMENVCISKPGVSTCPAAWPTPETVYTDAADTRTCSACSCTPNQLSCTADKFNLMQAPGCVDFGPFPTFTSAACTGYSISSQNQTWSIQRVPTTKQISGSCTPSGGVASGSLQPTGQTTLCCR